MTSLDPRTGQGLRLIPDTATVVRLRGELDIGTGRSLGIVLGLAAPGPHLARVLRLAGLARSFPMYGKGTGRVGLGPGPAR